MNKTFRRRLNAGELLIGTIVTLPEPAVAEILVEAGFDWLFVDTEHATFGPSGAQDLLRAAGDRCACVVRVPSGDDVWIKKVLDSGACGVIVPQVHTATLAEQVVRASKYPPVGARGVGVARAQGYGMHVREYLDRANDDTAVIVQVESAEGVGNAQAIASVPGIDSIFIGPFDLAASLGHMAEPTHPEVREAMSEVRAACLRAGKKLGIFGVDAAAVEPFLADGYTLIAVSADTLLLAEAARSTLTAMRRGM